MRDLSRLTWVELVKYFSTRSTAVLSLGSFGISCAVILAVNFYTQSTGGTLSVGSALSLATLPVGLLVPIAGIIIFTSDWQHRDATTFIAIAPGRMVLFASKLLASLLIAMGLLVGLVAVAYGATMLHAALLSADVELVATEPIVNLTAAVFIGTICGSALGAALMSAVLAIAFSIIQTLLIDPTLGFLPGGLGAYFKVASITGDWASLPSPWAIATSALLWIVAPLAIGAARFARREP